MGNITRTCNTRIVDADTPSPLTTNALLQQLIQAQHQTTQELKDLITLTKEMHKAQSLNRSSFDSTLKLIMDTGLYGGRTYKEIYVQSSTAADFLVSGSTNGVTWRVVDTLSLTAAGSKHKGYFNAYRHVRVHTNTIADNFIEITSSR